MRSRRRVAPCLMVLVAVLLVLAVAVTAMALGCGTLREAQPSVPTRCLNEVGWNGYAWTTLPEKWVDDSFCRPIPKRDPSWRCAATDSRDAAGFGEVSYRWASCDLTSKGERQR